ncbi:unnamed protein product [Ixodes persulcatus]
MVLTPDELPRSMKKQAKNTKRKKGHDTAGAVDTRNREKRKKPKHQALKTPRLEGVPVNTLEFRPPAVSVHQHGKAAERQGAAMEPPASGVPVPRGIHKGTRKRRRRLSESHE